MAFFIAVFALMILFVGAILVFGGVGGFLSLSSRSRKDLIKVILMLTIIYFGINFLLRLAIGLLNRYYLDNPEAPLFYW